MRVCAIISFSFLTISMNLWYFNINFRARFDLLGLFEVLKRRNSFAPKSDMKENKSCQWHKGCKVNNDHYYKEYLGCWFKQLSLLRHYTKVLEDQHKNNKRVCYKDVEDETLVILLSNTVIEPYTMMVKVFNTFVASSAVLWVVLDIELA